MSYTSRYTRNQEESDTSYLNGIRDAIERGDTEEAKQRGRDAATAQFPMDVFFDPSVEKLIVDAGPMTGVFDVRFTDVDGVSFASVDDEGEWCLDEYSGVTFMAPCSVPRALTRALRRSVTNTFVVPPRTYDVAMRSQ